MILKALYDYYYRSGNDVAPEGLEYKEIGFVIVIDRDGNFTGRIENRIGTKKLVVKTNGRTGKKFQPNHLWDNFAYVLGISKENLHINDDDLSADIKKNEEDVQKRHSAFVQYVNELASLHEDDEDLRAICMFYEKNKDLFSLLRECDNFEEIKNNLNKNISFLIQGELQIVAEKEKILSYYLSSEYLNRENNDLKSICLVTGEKCVHVKTFSKIQLGKYSNTKLVSFQKNKGYDSYGKEQGGNATMSKPAEFAIATALKKLVASGSHNIFSVGNRSFVYWASRVSDSSKLLEDSIYAIFGWQRDDDDPNARVKHVTEAYKSIYSGKILSTSDDRFYILGLYPANEARIAISYWCEQSVEDFAKKIRRHFEDMEIIKPDNINYTNVGVLKMLEAVSFAKDIKKNCPPNLPEAVVKSIFEGIPYPASLYQACIRRIRAEVSKEKISFMRAAIIKAYLNRLNDNNNKKIEIMLDKENTNLGYLCGRLFAVLDKIQYAANGQNSIRTSYMNAASVTPTIVFGRILSLSNAHITKLKKEKPGLAFMFESMKTEIMDKISAVGFPAHLDLQDQGRFFVGYYHQMNDKKETDTDN